MSALTIVPTLPIASTQELRDQARREVADAYDRAVAILAADPAHPDLADYRLRLRAARLAAGLPTVVMA